MAKIPSVYLGSSGLKVSVLALGTMTFGNWGKASQCADEATAFAILDAYAAAGGNFIDTADIYAGGESEITVGKWLALRKSERHKFVLASKARFSSDPGAGPNDVGLSRHHLLRSVNSSLERLGVEYIDLFQCHAWDSGTPLEETLRTLDDLVKAGKIHYVGWSNVTGWQLQKIVCESRRLGLSPCVSLQAQYSLLCRQTEYELTDVCVGEGVGLLVWSPLKGGWLSGKVKRDPEAQAASVAGSRIGWAEANGIKQQSAPTLSAFKDDERVWGLLDGMADISAAHAGSTVAHVALRWLLSRRSVTSVVLGVKTLAQLQENLAVLALDLGADELARLDSLSELPAVYPYEMTWRVNAGRNRPGSTVGGSLPAAGAK